MPEIDRLSSKHPFAVYATLGIVSFNSPACAWISGRGLSIPSPEKTGPEVSVGAGIGEASTPTSAQIATSVSEAAVSGFSTPVASSAGLSVASQGCSQYFGKILYSRTQDAEEDRPDW